MIVLFCCALPYVHSSIAIIFMGKRELVALLNLPSWCLVMVERLFLAVPRGCLQFVIVVFPDHTHLLFLKKIHAWEQMKVPLYLISSLRHVIAPVLLGNRCESDCRSRGHEFDPGPVPYFRGD